MFFLVISNLIKKIKKIPTKTSPVFYGILKGKDVVYAFLYSLILKGELILSIIVH